ncbi:uncharacterized protein LOC125651346 [Ostrea edulis]|uniref:uncharacterized protein LOC125651346 n=1 Tax=Ostrea edulis TaxID=37623 RepID=UPI0024AF2547|nr:uncharacterized protein LOC125651346 [Ostrea edulis]
MRKFWIAKHQEEVSASEKNRLLMKNTEELWGFLELAIGTENDVQIRRNVLELFMEVKNASQVARNYLSGSINEGFIFPWSDVDVMTACLAWDVVIQGKGYTSTHSLFQASDVDCHPGFCKLLRNPYYCSYSTDINVGAYFSRVTFLCKQVKLSVRRYVVMDTRINGPCHTMDSPGFDSCHALPIHTISSNEFLKRFSTKFWNNVKSKIIEKNITVMHVVPKGPPEGDIEGIEWLKSFSVLEQHIVHSLNHVQLCCYGLLKVLIHFEVETCRETRDTLCSYHAKTVLFHVLEDIHSDFWIPSNIFYCLWICLTRLLLFVKRGVCPNYFIPECNLFLKKRISEKKRKIEETLLQVLQSEPYTVLFNMKSLYATYSLKLLQNIPTYLRKHLTLRLALIFVNGYHLTYFECTWSILKAIHLLQNERNEIKRTTLKYLFMLLMRRAGVILYEKYILYGKTKYLLTAEAAFIVARHSDASGGLYLATLWYCCGKFKRSMKLVSSILKKLADSDSPHISYDIPPGYDLSKPWCSFRDLMRSNSFLMMELYKDSSFLPKALEKVVRKDSRTLEEFIMYDKSYAFFLMFLCQLELNGKEKCLQMRKELNKSYEDSNFSYLRPQVQQNSKILAEVVDSKMTELTSTF